MIIRSLIDASPDVCGSTEVLFSRIEEYKSTGDHIGCIVESMDVVSLYTLIDIDFTVERCIDMTIGSDTKLRDVYTNELGLFLRLAYEDRYLLRDG